MTARIVLFLVLLVACTVTPSLADLTTTGAGSRNAAGGGGCSNSLDFTQACNSQYVGVF